MWSFLQKPFHLSTCLTQLLQGPKPSLSQATELGCGQGPAPP